MLHKLIRLQIATNTWKKIGVKTDVRSCQCFSQSWNKCHFAVIMLLDFIRFTAHHSNLCLNKNSDVLKRFDVSSYFLKPSIPPSK